MPAVHRGVCQQTALLPRSARPALQAAWQRPPAAPSHQRQAAPAAPAAAAAVATNILRSSIDDADKVQQQQQQPEDSQPTGTGSTTPYPTPGSSHRTPPNSNAGPKLKPGPSGSKGSSGGGPKRPEPGDRPPSNLPPQLQRLLVLLTEYGGIYGTAAVAIAWLTHVDPFGNLHWSPGDILQGLATFAPLLALDALLMLPDYAIGPEDSQEVAGMFFGGPEALRNMSAGDISVAATPSSSTTSTDGGSSGSADTAAAAKSADASSSSSSSSGGGGSSPNSLLRVRVALELLQQVYTRSNPGIGLSPVAELAVVAVAVLADEMLYRAVGLTLLGLWVRDRLYEAGCDEAVSLAGLGHTWALPTPEFARYAAVALVACLGMAGFAAGALREREALKRLQVLDKDGTPSEKADALKAQLVASIGSQNLVMYGVEGVREVTAAVMAGVSFVTSGNLAAPLAGSLAAQILFSVYQRYSLARSKKKRQELLGRMKARSHKLKAAMEAALTAKKAAAAGKESESAAAPASSTSSSEGSSSSSSGREVVASLEAVDSSSSSEKQEDVDFLTLVVQAAEQQQEQEKQQRRQQQHTAAAPSSGNGVGAAAEEATISGADWAAAIAGNNSSSEAASSGSSSSSSSSGSGGEAAKQQLSVLLEDMLRSPEGFKVVQRWLQSQTSGSSSSSVSSGRSSSSGTTISSTDPRQAVEQLLSDPEVKARLLAELQDQLCAMSDAQARRQKQQDTWRQ